MPALTVPQRVDRHRHLAVVHAPFALQRQGVVMRPVAGSSWEEGGVLNPVGARSRDGREHYLLALIHHPLVASGVMG